jgi:hypothetical protein
MKIKSKLNGRYLRTSTFKILHCFSSLTQIYDKMRHTGITIGQSSVIPQPVEISLNNKSYLLYADTF